MLFFIEKYSSSPRFKQNDSVDYFIFNTENITSDNHQSHAIIKTTDLLTTIYASLKNKKMVIVAKLDSQLPELNELEKNRILVTDQFIFLATRATYFFNQLSANIDINNYEDLEKLVVGWGK